MKIYDCFQFFDEEMLLDLRLNIMNKYVDKFVITEATYMHNGKSKKLIFTHFEALLHFELFLIPRRRGPSRSLPRDIMKHQQMA